jgi:hypothetical protein
MSGDKTHINRDSMFVLKHALHELCITGPGDPMSYGHKDMHANLATKYAGCAGHYSAMYPDRRQPQCLHKGLIRIFLSRFMDPTKMTGKSGRSHNSSYSQLWKTALGDSIHGPPDAVTFPNITYIADPESDKEDKSDSGFDDSSDDGMCYSERDDEFASGDTGNTVLFGTNDFGIAGSSTAQPPADTATQTGGANLDLLRLPGTPPAVVVMPATAAVLAVPVTEAEHGLCAPTTNGQAGQDGISPREDRVYMKGGQSRQQEWELLVRVCKEHHLTSFSDVAVLCRIEDAFCKCLDVYDQKHRYRHYSAICRKIRNMRHGVDDAKAKVTKWKL